MEAYLFYEDMIIGEENFPFRADTINMPIFQIDSDISFGKNIIPELFYDLNNVASIKTHFIHDSNSNLALLPKNLTTELKSILPEKMFYHMHRFFEISYIISGRGFYFVDNKYIEVKSGDLIMFNQAIPHSWYVDKSNIPKIKTFTFYPSLLFFKHFYDLNIEYLSALFNAENSYLYLNSQEELTSALSEILLRTEIEYIHKRTGYEVMITSQLLEFCTLLIRRKFDSKIKRQETFNSNSFKKAIEYINENFNNKITENEVAKIACLSTCYFSDYFKKTIGMTFVKYISRLRISKAIELLKTTDASLNAIAEKCGYNNTSGLYKAFKTTYGISPKEVKSSSGVKGSLNNDSDI